MKKLLLITAMLFAVITAVNAQSGTVEVFSEDGDKFWVIINGQKQNVQPLANVKIPGIKEQWFKMRVIFDNEAIPNLDQQVQMVGVDNVWMDVTYAIKKNNKGKYVIRGSAWKESADQGKGTTVTTTTQAQPTETKSTTTTTTTSKPVNTNTNTTTTETTTVKTNTMGVGTNVDVKEDGENVSMNMNINLQGLDGMMTDGTVKTTTTTTTKTTKTSSGNYEAEETPAETKVATKSAPAKKTCSMPMNGTDFTNAKQSVASKGFDETRLQIANQVLNNNCLKTAQVIEMMKVFSFEESKLSFAKSAYAKTTDKNNYFMVNDQFSFSTTIDELNSYISSQPE